MNILGINGACGWDANVADETFASSWVHGSGATLVTNGILKGSISEERKSRIKYDGNFPHHSVDSLLATCGLDYSSVDKVGFVTNVTNLSLHYKKSGYIGSQLNIIFPNAKVVFVDHHDAHAAASFFTSPFDEANVFTLDGAGDVHLLPDNSAIGATCSSFSNLTKQPFSFQKIYTGYVEKKEFGLGNFFNDFAILTYLKIKKNNLSSFQFLRESCAGKIMGLAGYGKESNIPLPNPFYVFLPTPYSLPLILTNSQMYNFCREECSQEKYNPEDIAAWSQSVFEETLVAFFKAIPKSYKKDYLCLGGGCALNILLNSRLIDEGIYKDVHVCTAPNDDGLNIGAALLLAHEVEGNVILPSNIGCIGLDYRDEEIEKALKEVSEKIIVTKIEDANELYDFVSTKLTENNIVGWFQGKSEFGPRALCNRSILANPCYENKQVLNEKVKFRESWRPYAAAILQEDLEGWIDIPKKDSHYMLFSGVVKELKRAAVPAVTHVDNTCRIQTVNSEVNDPAYQLIKKFKEKTGVPLLLNTSFNTLPGEPIVETPQDAIRSFLYSKVDLLVLHNYVVTKK